MPLIVKLPSKLFAPILPWAMVGCEVEGVEIVSTVELAGAVLPYVIAHTKDNDRSRDLMADGPMLNRTEDLYDSDGLLKSERRGY